MHNTTEIEKAAEDYTKQPLMPFKKVTKESLYEFEKLAFQAGAEWQKLNSENQSNFEAFAIESIKENEKTQIGEVGNRLSLKEACLWMSQELSRLNDITGQDNRIDEQLVIVHEILEDESATDKPEELQEEVKKLRAALEKIYTMQLNSPTEAEGRLYDCIDIAERALNQK